MEEVKNTSPLHNVRISEPFGDKEPWVAVVLSGLLPGLGQFYGSAKVKGIFIFSCIEVLFLYGLWLIISCDGDTILGYLLVCVAALLDVLSWVDAYLAIERHNSRSFERVRRQTKDPFLAIFLSSLIPGLGHLYATRWLFGSMLVLIFLYLLLLRTNYYVQVAACILSGVIAYRAYLITKNRDVTFKNTKCLIATIALTSFFSATTEYLCREYFVTPALQHGNSNTPTIIDGDIALRNISRRAHIRRGDFVSFQGDPIVKNETLTKRAVAFEGETIEIKGGSAYIDGKRIEAAPIGSMNYTADSSCAWAREGSPLTIPSGYVFVLGDNSGVSLDSRCFGPIEMGKIVGVNCKILWPLRRVKKL